MAVAGEEEVLGLQVAVHDAASVGGVQAAADLHGQLQRLADGERSVQQPLPEGLAFEQLENGVKRPVLGPEIVESQDVRVIQGGHRPRLLPEALDAAGGLGALGGQHLDRDISAQARVVGAVHLAHASCAERRNHLVRPETGTDW